MSSSHLLFFLSFYFCSDVQDDDIYHVLPSCNLATEFLAFFMQSSHANCLALGTAPQLNNGKALSTLLQRCGNFSLQLDISEVFYQYFVTYQKMNSDPDYQGAPFPELKAFSMAAPLKKLVSKDIMHETVNFPQELRNVVMGYNSTLKTLAR